MRDLYRRIRIPTGKRPVCLGESTKIPFLVLCQSEEEGDAKNRGKQEPHSIALLLYKTLFNL